MPDIIGLARGRVGLETRSAPRQSVTPPQTGGVPTPGKSPDPKAGGGEQQGRKRRSQTGAAETWIDGRKCLIKCYRFLPTS